MEGLYIYVAMVECMCMNVKGWRLAGGVVKQEVWLVTGNVHMIWLEYWNQLYDGGFCGDKVIS